MSLPPPPEIVLLPFPLTAIESLPPLPVDRVVTASAADDHVVPGMHDDYVLPLPPWMKLGFPVGTGATASPTVSVTPSPVTAETLHTTARAARSPRFPPGRGERRRIVGEHDPQRLSQCAPVTFSTIAAAAGHGEREALWSPELSRWRRRQERRTPRRPRP